MAADHPESLPKLIRDEIREQILAPDLSDEEMKAVKALHLARTNGDPAAAAIREANRRMKKARLQKPTTHKSR